MATDIYAETIALAALFQAAAQIQHVARFGSVDEKACAPLMRALVITNPSSIEEIYAPSRIIPGLEQLVSTLGPKEATNPRNAELLKIGLNIMRLESSIEKQAMIFDMLDREVDQLRDRVLTLHSDYVNSPDNVLLDYDIIRLYSDIYSRLISPNFPKLIIYGEEEYLRRPEFQEIIRALLLAGIRASLLWHQVGGKRYSLMFRYKDIIQCSQETLRRHK